MRACRSPSSASGCRPLRPRMGRYGAAGCRLGSRKESPTKRRAICSLIRPKSTWMVKRTSLSWRTRLWALRRLVACGNPLSWSPATTLLKEGVASWFFPTGTIWDCGGIPQSNSTTARRFFGGQYWKSSTATKIERRFRRNSAAFSSSSTGDDGGHFLFADSAKAKAIDAYPIFGLGSDAAVISITL